MDFRYYHLRFGSKNASGGVLEATSNREIRDFFGDFYGIKPLESGVYEVTAFNGSYVPMAVNRSSSGSLLPVFIRIGVESKLIVGVDEAAGVKLGDLLEGKQPYLEEISRSDALEIKNNRELRNFVGWWGV